MHREVKFKLTKTQMEKLALAHRNNTGVSFRLNKSNISANGIPLLLTNGEIVKIQTGLTHTIALSPSRVKQGGFLPALLAALPVIASVIGGVSGLTGIASNIKTMVTGSGNRCKCGKGVLSDLIGGIPLIGNFLAPTLKSIGLGRKKRRAKGLYLKN